MKPSLCQHCGAVMRPGDPLHFLHGSPEKQTCVYLDGNGQSQPHDYALVDGEVRCRRCGRKR